MRQVSREYMNSYTVATMSTETNRNMMQNPCTTVRAAHVSQVHQLSPLRYPGGKTWLVPHVCSWLRHVQPKQLVEPFAGGGIVSLTALKENLVDNCVMIELDPDVAVFWQMVLQQSEALAQRIETFELTRDHVEALDQETPSSPLDHAFRTLVRNRTRRAGILAPGATLIRKGENSKGLASRWYPTTLARRIREIQPYAERIDFRLGDAMTLLPSLLRDHDGQMALFVDPPYTAGGRNAGQRLYTFHQLNHQKLFFLLAHQNNPFLMTYDDTPEIKNLVTQNGFHAEQVYRKNAHHNIQPELVITKKPWYNYHQTSPGAGFNNV